MPRRSAPRSIRRRCAVLPVMLCALGSAGCLSGGIYKHTTEPFDLNLNQTPAHLEATPQAERGESWRTLRIPLQGLVGFDIRFDWGDMSVQQAMADAGIETVHYADLETRSFLGIWTQRWLHVYGE